MAVTILNQPTTPNVTGTSLVYSLSGSEQNEPQFRYITDIYYSGSTDRLTRLFTNKNLYGNTNINVASILGDYLDYDYNWKTVGEENTNSSKTFNIEFGEQYAASVTGPVTDYSASVSSSIQVFLGSIQYPSVASYDTGSNTITLQSSSINYNSLENLYNDVGRYSDGTLSNSPNLNNAPVSSKYRQEDNFAYGSQWWWKQLWVSSSTPFYSAQPTSLNDYTTEHYLTPFTMDSRFVLFNDNNERIWYGDIVDNPTAAYPNPLVYSIGTGLANLAGATNLAPYTASLGTGPLSASISSSNQWNWYVVTSYPGNAEAGTIHFYYNEDKGADNLISISTGSTSDFLGRWGDDVPPLKPSLWANKYYPTNCNNEKTRFAFINSFGVWDYYNVYMPTRRVTNINKQFYEVGNVKLNQSVTNYNVSDRGTTQYFTDYSDQFEITTETVDSQESQWLKELFTSPEVYIQSGSNFIPVNILNTSETISNDTARNKNYRYTITYQYSNNREPR
jgi:hypothetical protein